MSERFLPPRHLLDAIEASPLGGLEVITKTPNLKEEMYNYLVDWQWVTVISHFGRDCTDFATHCATITNEAFTNAADHGNRGKREKKIQMLVWPGAKGILFGIRDEGDYFRRHDIKETIESRSLVLSTRQDYTIKGNGLPILYEASILHVATDENVLYLVMLKAEQ